jgi:hypothetical protein
MPKGTVVDCISNAEVVINVSNVVACNVKWQVSALLGSLGPSKHKNTKHEGVVTVFYGGIVGENRGICEDCVTEGQQSLNAKRNGVSVANSYGYAKATTNIYFGEVTGKNIGKVSGCIDSSNTNYNGGENDYRYVKDSYFYAEEYYYNINRCIILQ